MKDREQASPEETIAAIPGMDDRELLELVAYQQCYIMQEFQRYQPLLERYERAANANSVFGARRALRNG